MSHLPMPVCPIDSGRYGSEEMRALFTDPARYRLFAEIEGTVAKVQSRLGMIPEEAGPEIWRRAQAGTVPLERVREIEAGSRHEVMAVIQAFAESCGPYGRYVHCGPTSSDIIDTAIALQLRAAIRILDARVRSLVGALSDLADAHKATPMVGRTHGQHALPITFGFKAANWADEALRHLDRLTQLAPRVLVGKMAGAVGSMAGFGRNGQVLQAEVMAALGLSSPPITTQVVSRDRLAEFVCWAALVAASLDTVATEVRNLQRPELGEVTEFFDEASQIGSSTMPQKRNPVVAENVSGLSRMVRSLVVPALETVSLWHERDLTNSSVERFTIPMACILLDDMLAKTASMVRGLVIHADRMQANLQLSKSSILSEGVMLALVGKRMDRQQAYSLARQAANTARRENLEFRDALGRLDEVRALLNDEELAAVLDAPYLGECVPLTEAIVRRCRAQVRGDD